MADKILKSIQFPGLEDTYIIPSYPIKEGEFENSIILNDMANQALAPYSTAAGVNTRAGILGYRLKEVINNDGITAEIVVDDANLEDKARDVYATGDTLCFDGKSHFYTELTINSLSSTIIDGTLYSIIKIDISPLTVKPQTGIQVDTNDDGTINMDEKENWVWVAEKSFGIPMLRSQGAYSNGVALSEEGEQIFAIGFGANTFGRNTKAIGDYAHAEGRNTVANYAAHAEGLNTKALNQYAHAEGYNTQALAVASHAEGANTIVTGERAHAEGTSTQAKGNNSHAEGSYTISEGLNSHSEGGSLNENTPTVAKGDYSHAEGHGSRANGAGSHAEGRNNTAEGNNSHAEGRDGIARGENSHTEGIACETGENAKNSHAEGWATKAFGEQSHTEGWGTRANGDNQHVQGRWNIVDANNQYAHIVGNGNVDRTDPSNPITTRSNAHTLDWDGNAWFAGDVYVGENSEVLAKKSEVPVVYDWAKAESKPGYSADEISNIVGKKVSNSSTSGEIFNDYTNNEAAAYSHAEGYTTKATALYSHTEGYGSQADGKIAHAEGRFTQAIGNNSHSEGNTSKAIGTASHAENYKTVSGGNSSHTEGEQSITGKFKKDENGNFLDEAGNITTDATNYVYESEGAAAHAEGYKTQAESNYSHAEGRQTLASGTASHAEGRGTVASGESSHAEGQGSDATGNYSHAEGYDTTASGSVSHAEGSVTVASGSYSHAEGYKSEARASYSHAEGRETLASGSYQHAQGKYNIEDTNNKYAHIVGNGTSDTARSNAHTLDWNGNAWFAGDVYVGANNDKLLKESDNIFASRVIESEDPEFPGNIAISDCNENGWYSFGNVLIWDAPYDPVIGLAMETEFQNLAVDGSMKWLVHNNGDIYVQGAVSREWCNLFEHLVKEEEFIQPEIGILTNEVIEGKAVYKRLSNSGEIYYRLDGESEWKRYAKLFSLDNVANERQYSAQNPPPYPVSSVNGKTGEVTLSTSDIGAMPQQCAYVNTAVSADTITAPFVLLDISANNTELRSLLGGANFAYIQTQYYSSVSGWRLQVAHSYAIDPPKMAFRTEYQGVWSSWTSPSIPDTPTYPYVIAESTVSNLTMSQRAASNPNDTLAIYYFDYTCRKWSNGIIEIFGRSKGSTSGNLSVVTTDVATPWGDLYETGAFVMPSYPETLTSCLYANVSFASITGSAIWAEGGHWGNLSGPGNVYFCRATAVDGEDAAQGNVCTYTVGTWK